MKRVLHLTLREEFFEKIADGSKKTEFREYKPYWKVRLEGKRYDVIKFRNGYAANAPEMTVRFRGVKRCGKKYEISLRRVLSKKRWPCQKRDETPRDAR